MSRNKIGHSVRIGRKPRGILVVIEGMDGVGKSTLTIALEETLAGQGVPVHRTREPTNGPFGMLLRERQASGIRYTPWEEYWLFMLDRVAHGREIRQYLAEGSVVLSDRYWHSTWVYQVPRMMEPQSLSEEADQRILTELVKQATGTDTVAWDAAQERRNILVQEAAKITPTPDLLFILDLSVEEAQKRILTSRGALDVFETTELLARYRADYQRLAENQGGLLLGADRPIEVLVEKVRKRVMRLRDGSIAAL